MKYAFFDGDNIGATLESLLNQDKVQEAAHLSESIKLAINKIESFVKLDQNAEIIIVGGDDVLIKYEPDKCEKKFLENIVEIFKVNTGLSMSCGLGENIDQSIYNLAIAKQTNKGSIFESSVKINRSDFMEGKNINLFCFIESLNPDIYINLLQHCKEHYGKINQIIFIKIFEKDKGKRGDNEDQANTIKEGIIERLKLLAEGLYWDKATKQNISIKISNSYKDKYRNLIKIVNSIEIETCFYEELENELSRLGLFFFDKYFDKVIDVTACRKRHLLDIYSILRQKKIINIYSFEIYKEQFFNHEDLIDKLFEKSTYNYVRLSSTPYTKNKILVSEESIESSKKLNELQKKLNDIYEEEATKFARAFIFAYIIVAIIIFALIIFALPTMGISSLSAYITVAPFITFLIIYLIRGILILILKDKASTFDYISFKPNTLFLKLKNWKLKKLRANSKK